MSEIETVIAHLKERERFYVEYYQPEWMFADEVVRELSKFTTSDYNIFEIFSKEIIANYILSPGEQCLLANMAGGKLESFIKSDSGNFKSVDHTDIVPIYIKVFKEWEDAGWIVVKTAEDNEKFISIRVNDEYSTEKYGCPQTNSGQ